MVVDKIYRKLNKDHYGKMVSDAEQIIIDSIKTFGEPAAVGISGGKDSTALVHLVSKHCKPLLIWNDSGLELPESIEIVKKLADLLSLELAIAKGVDAMERKISIGAIRSSKEVSRTDDLCIVQPVKKCLRENGIKVEFVGLRSQESKTRKMVLKKYGPFYDSKRWGCGISWPMMDWGVEDVFAYIDEFNLPLHPAYGRKWDDRNNIRVSWMWDSNFDGFGGIQYLRRYYPKVFQKLRNKGVLPDAF
jgi:3'-phosphoadenosine 5'-phosphosulfate sulfotransferase (PAPS reductase)/FAD synthetase